MCCLPPPFMLSPGRFTGSSPVRHLWLSAMVAVVVLSRVGKGSACEPPGNPQCFRNTSKETTYMCEWGRSNSSNVLYDLFLLDVAEELPNVSWMGLKDNWKEVKQREGLLINSPMYIVVTAHTGNTSCKSAKTTVTLKTCVKFPPPCDVKASWSDRKLTLTWIGQGEPTSVGVLVRSLESETQTLKNITNMNTTNDNKNVSVSVADLERQTAYQVQVRQKSTNVNTTWSDWSSTHTVPAEIKQTPEVELKSTDFENGTRLLVVTWKAVPPAERAGGVNYTLTNPQHGCPGSGRTMVSSTNHRLYVTYSAVNLSISVTNGAGTSTPRYFYEPAKPAKDLKACEKNLTDIHRQVPKNSCVEWYEFKEEDTQPTAVKTLLAKMCISKMLEEMEDYVRYSYLEHKCDQGVPQTVEMCLLYKKEGVPLIKPLDFTGVNETDSSVDLSWLSIPPKDQRAFITHYALCHSKTNQSQEIKRTEEVCRNLSASQTKFRLENLAPETEYNISLAGVTRVGSGPRAILILPTFPPKQPLAAGSFLVWISLGLLITFFVASILCSFVVKRFKSMIFLPIPKLILCSPFNGAANQQELEQREQVDEVSVHLQLVLGGKHHSFDEEDNVDIAKTLLGTDEDQIQRESFESPGGQEEALYRNGLVFDMKAEEDRRSPESWCG